MCLLCLMGASGPQQPSSEPGVTTLSTTQDVNALLAYLETESARWNALTDLKTPVIVTYAFLEGDELPDTAEVNPYGSDRYFAFSTAQRADFRKAAQIAMQTAGVVLVESPRGNAMIDIYNSSGADYAGWAHYPSVSIWGATPGHLVLDFAPGASYAPGTFAFEAMLHELGHALGLKHPFDGDITLNAETDNTANTLMSYTHLDSDYFSSYRPLDVQALTRLYGGPVNTTGWKMAADGANLTMTLSPRGEILVGAAGQNTIFARAGNDTLIGGASHDRLFGGRGDDLIIDSRGQLVGGAGNDRLIGGIWGETLVGGDDNDTLRGNGGDDTLRGQGGNDRLIADDPNDLYTSNDLLRGGFGKDTLLSAAGDDSLFGGDGDDRIVATDAFASIDGGRGADVIIIRGSAWAEIDAGPGNDVLRLDGLAHELRIDTRHDHGTDRITGFDTIRDMIVVAGAADPVFSRYGGGKLALTLGEAHLRFTDLVWADRDQIIFI